MSNPRHRWSFNNENVWLHVYGIDGPGTTRVIEVPAETALRFRLTTTKPPQMLRDWLRDAQSWLEGSHPDISRWLLEEDET